jgi:hypothetical protein
MVSASFQRDFEKSLASPWGRSLYRDRSRILHSSPYSPPRHWSVSESDLTFVYWVAKNEWAGSDRAKDVDLALWEQFCNQSERAATKSDVADLARLIQKNFEGLSERLQKLEDDRQKKLAFGDIDTNDEGMPSKLVH